MFYFPGQQVLPYNIYSHPAYLPGPIGIGGVYIPPQTVQEGAGGIPRPSPRPAPPSPPAPPPNSPQKRKGDDEGDAEKKVKKPKKKPNPYAPPPLRPGVNFLFPRETTQLHVFKKAAKVWDKKYEGQDLYVITLHHSLVVARSGGFCTEVTKLIDCGPAASKSGLRTRR